VLFSLFPKVKFTSFSTFVGGSSEPASVVNLAQTLPIDRPSVAKMSSDKKNEDLEARMPERFADEKQGFLSNRPKGLQSGGMSWPAIEKSPGASILAYCLSSISMTIVNKYVVSGNAWNLPLFYLAVQVGTKQLCPQQCKFWVPSDCPLRLLSVLRPSRYANPLGSSRI